MRLLFGGRRHGAGFDKHHVFRIEAFLDDGVDLIERHGVELLWILVEPSGIVAAEDRGEERTG